MISFVKIYHEILGLFNWSRQMKAPLVRWSLALVLFGF